MKKSDIYCNPLPLPDYPRGKMSLNKEDKNYGWVNEKMDFREAADPSVIFHENKWYLYPSCGMAYVSEDFTSWKHYPLEPYDIGYAPTVVKFNDKFYLTATQAPLYISDNPLGPFNAIGFMTKKDGEVLKNWHDPMLFADDDGSIYAYWGLAGDGIKGAELDPQDPTRLITEPKILFSYDPAHEWERYGEFNEDKSKSFVEGAWMFKYKDTYYLIYAAPGTQFKNYALGTYISDSPLGPFVYQPHNPILRKSAGIVNGTGHGSIVNGPNETIWVFYTCLVRKVHIFERRIGMDQCIIDNQGRLIVPKVTETPQPAPGINSLPGSDLLPVSVNKRVKVSSGISGHEGALAVDNCIRTDWRPSAEDRNPFIEIDLDGDFYISCFRVIWSEHGLDYDAGIVPGPVKYKVEAFSSKTGKWKVVADKTQNKDDLLIDFVTFKELEANKVKLYITAKPKGINTGLADFTVFGYT